MEHRARILSTTGVAFLLALATASAGATPIGATPLAPHKATYSLVLDGSRSSGRLEALSGQIDYEIRGDACDGYTTLTRQSNEGDAGDGAPQRSMVSATAWEDPQGNEYRFETSTTASDKPATTVAGTVSRGADGLTVKVTKPEPRSIDLKGRILMPTEHVRKVLEAAAAGESLLEAKVYDGSTEPDKVYDTLAVIGRPSSEDARAPEAAKGALAGHTFYPIALSYFEQQSGDRTPAYVMTMTLYDNGVVGNLKIDYGAFALKGTLSSFEALKPSETCKK